MAIKTFLEEAAKAYWSHLNTIFQRFWSTYGITWFDSLLCNCLPLSSVSPAVDEKYHTNELKGNFEEREHLQKGIFRQCMKTLLSKKQYIVSRIVSALQRFWPIALSILMLLPNLVIACELDRDCTLWHGKRNDATLDARDVEAFLSERDFFNGSSRNYNKVCPDAVAHAPIRCFILSYNNITSLPGNLFFGISDLEEVELQGNPLTEVPSVLNNTKTIRNLNLADTNITVIPKYSINGMLDLSVLDLSRTGITDVPKDIFDLPKLKLVHLSQTKLDRLPLPPPTSVAFNVTLVEAHGNELSISYPDSGKRKIGINITGIETLTCENAKTAVESSYCVLAGEIVCDHGSFRKINILLRGKSKISPSCALEENANEIFSTVTTEMISDISPLAPVANRGAENPSSDSCKNTVSLFILFIGLIFGVSYNLIYEKL